VQSKILIFLSLLANTGAIDLSAAASIILAQTKALFEKLMNAFRARDESDINLFYNLALGVVTAIAGILALIPIAISLVLTILSLCGVACSLLLHMLAHPIQLFMHPIMLFNEWKQGLNAFQTDALKFFASIPKYTLQVPLNYILLTPSSHFAAFLAAMAVVLAKKWTNTLLELCRWMGDHPMVALVFGLITFVYVFILSIIVLAIVATALTAALVMSVVSAVLHVITHPLDCLLHPIASFQAWWADKVSSVFEAILSRQDFSPFSLPIGELLRNIRAVFQIGHAPQPADAHVPRITAPAESRPLVPIRLINNNSHQAHNIHLQQGTLIVESVVLDLPGGGFAIGLPVDPSPAATEPAATASSSSSSANIFYLFDSQIAQGQERRIRKTNHEMRPLGAGTANSAATSLFAASSHAINNNTDPHENTHLLLHNDTEEPQGHPALFPNIFHF